MKLTAAAGRCNKRPARPSGHGHQQDLTRACSAKRPEGLTAYRAGRAAGNNLRPLGIGVPAPAGLAGAVLMAAPPGRPAQPVGTEPPKSRNGKRTLPLDDELVSALTELRKRQAGRARPRDTPTGRASKTSTGIPQEMSTW